MQNEQQLERIEMILKQHEEVLKQHDKLITQLNVIVCGNGGKGLAGKIDDMQHDVKEISNFVNNQKGMFKGFRFFIWVSLTLLGLLGSSNIFLLIKFFIT